MQSNTTINICIAKRFFCACGKIKKNEMGRACGAYGGGESVYRVLVGKPEGKRPLGRPRRRWEDNIKMDLEEVGGAYGDWMERAQDRDRWWALVNSVMNFRVP
jgi:drug/metabolite transporter superfamily protein YnfA